MAQFRYLTVKKMEPRPGYHYSTEYYQQTSEDRQKLQDHCESVIAEIAEHIIADQEVYNCVNQPLKRFPRSQRNEYYTAWDILIDVFFQLRAGRDLPQGMLGRWNRLFESNTQAQIDMILGLTVNEPTLNTAIFEYEL